MVRCWIRGTVFTFTAAATKQQCTVTLYYIHCHLQCLVTVGWVTVSVVGVVVVVP